MSERPLDQLWPQSARGCYQIGSRLYDLRKLTDFRVDFITARAQSRWFDNGEMTPWKPGPYGSCFLERTYQGIAVYANDGDKLNLPSSWDQGRKMDGQVIVDVFWCENGHIGRLFSKGDVVISTMSGDKVKRLESPDRSGVLCHSAFIGGIAFVTQARTLWVFDAMSWTYTPMSRGKIPISDTEGISAVGFNNGKAFIAVRQKLYHVDFDDLHLVDTMPLVDGPSHLIVSPKGDLVAAVAGRELFVISNSHLKFPKVSAMAGITSVAFLDDATVCYVWGTRMEILTAGSQVKPFDGDTYLVAQDPDSVRVMQNGRGYMLTPVHDSIQKLFRSPIIERLSTLVEAKQKYDAQDPDSYNMISSLGIHLEQLVISILDALGNVTDVGVVRRMYELAAFAKYFVAFKHDIALGYKNDLDITNELRSDRYKWFLTGSVFGSDRENKTNLVTLLCQLDCRNLAAVICRLYDVNPSIVAEYWARDLIQNYPRDRASACLDKIVKKVSCYDQVDFIRLAKKAHKKNFTSDIEAGFVKRETDAKKRMLYFQKSQGQTRPEEVRRNVMDSLDGNAMIAYLYINKMERGDKFGQWLCETIQKPFFIDQYVGFKRYCRGQGPDRPDGYDVIKQLRAISPTTELGLDLMYGWKHGPFGQDPQTLTELKRKFGSDKNSPYAQEVSHQEKLIQSTQSKGAIPPYPAVSPRLLMEHAIRNDDQPGFKRIAKIYNVSRRIQDLVELRTYIKIGQNLKIEKMAGLIPSSSDFDELACECMNRGLRKEALAFVRRVKPDKQFDLLDKFEFWQEALQLACKINDKARELYYRERLSES